jgi:predicted NUDIX family NTP pyrophosphohydrolase
MKQKTQSAADVTAGGCSVDRPVRHVFSVNVPDLDLAGYIEERAAMHPKGISGYIRDIVLVDRAKWQDMERLRTQALAKLTANERAALGFPLAKVRDRQQPKEGQ